MSQRGRIESALNNLIYPDLEKILIRRLELKDQFLYHKDHFVDFSPIGLVATIS
jgi:hypothetical protein